MLPNPVIDAIEPYRYTIKYIRLREDMYMEYRVKLNSFRLSVKDVERASTFYERILGVRPSYQGENCVLELNGMSIYLYDYQKYNENVVFGDNCLISFEVDDIFSLKSRLDELNIQIVFPLMKIGSNHVMEFKDPEGNDVEIYSKCDIGADSYSFY